jgi:Uma2 family endonuclease
MAANHATLTRDVMPPVTYGVLRTLPDDGKRYELEEGELMMAPAPSFRHQHVCLNLASALLAHVRRHELGYVVTAPIDVVLSDTTVYQPDICFVSRKRRYRIDPDYVDGPPDLVIEVISPRSQERDRVAKMRGYAFHGVPEYWLVDPDRRRVEVYQLRGKVFRLTDQVSGDGRWNPKLFPGLTLHLRRIWSEE